MSKKNLSSLATWYIRTTETILLETYSSIYGSFNLNFWTFPVKEEALLKLKKANLYSTAISSITAIFSCVQDNKQIKVIQWNLDIMNLNITKSKWYNKIFSLAQ